MDNFEQQGDQLFTYLGESVDVSKMEAVPDNIVALGSATGHKHTVVGDAQVYKNENDQLYIKVGQQGANVVHDTHGTTELQPGVSIAVSTVKEYDHYDEVVRDVAD